MNILCIIWIVGICSFLEAPKCRRIRQTLVRPVRADQQHRPAKKAKPSRPSLQYTNPLPTETKPWKNAKPSRHAKGSAGNTAISSKDKRMARPLVAPSLFLLKFISSLPFLASSRPFYMHCFLFPF